MPVVAGVALIRSFSLKGKEFDLFLVPRPRPARGARVFRVSFFAANAPSWLRCVRFAGGVVACDAIFVLFIHNASRVNLFVGDLCFLFWVWCVR